MSGTLIVFEGIDGVGKSTQIQMLKARLVECGHVVLLSREPTDGPFGKRIRDAALSGIRLERDEELSLFIEDRKEHVRDVIVPALNANKVVLLDRYYFSTAAYQGARGYDVAQLIADNEAFAPEPDCLLLLDQDPRLSLERIGNRGGVDAFEALEPLTRCRSIFSELVASRHYGHTIDASPGIDLVHEAIWAALPEQLKHPA